MYELEIPSIRSTLQAGTSGPVQFYVEYMDATRFPGEAHLQRTVGLLRQKYSAIAFDLVICVDESAFGLVQAHGGELFPETPKVFCAVSERFLQTLTLPRDMTGVTARIDIEGTLEAALRIQPETQHVAVVGGTSEIGRFFEGLTRKASRRYEGRIEFTYLSDLPMAEVLRRVASMPETSIVFYLFMFQDVDGMSYVPRDVAASLSTAANRPVYGLFDTFMGEGIVGGRLLSFEAVGAQAARLGLRILRGDPVDSLSVEECPTVYMFDWRQLQRWGIREDGLPPESIVKYRRPSLWEEHGGLIVAGLCVLLAQTGTIAALLIVRARRRKMQEVLQENEANLRAFIEGTENAICIRDRELRLVLWNHAFAASIKAHFDVDLRVGMRTEDYMPREMLARFSSLQALVTRALEGKAQQAEFEFPHPDGNIHHFEIGWSPVRQGNEIIAVAEVTRDVTERKAAEGRLREAERRYRTVADFTWDWEYWEDPDGGLRYVSPSCERITGYRADEFMGSPGLMTEVLIGEDRPIWLEHRRDPGRAEQSEVEFRIRTKDGQIRWIEHACAPVTDEDGAFLGYRGSNRDITKRKQAEESLRNSERRLAEAQRVAHLGGWDWDVATNELRWSDEVYRIFGLRPQEFGATYEAFLARVHPKDREALDQAVQKSLASPEARYDVEHRILRPDGSERIVQERATVTFDESGTAVRMVGTVQDITGRAEAQRESQRLPGQSHLNSFG